MRNFGVKFDCGDKKRSDEMRCARMNSAANDVISMLKSALFFDV
jgi:hypothetical protein